MHTSVSRHIIIMDCAIEACVVRIHDCVRRILPTCRRQTGSISKQRRSSEELVSVKVPRAKNAKLKETERER